MTKSNFIPFSLPELGNEDSMLYFYVDSAETYSRKQTKVIIQNYLEKKSAPRHFEINSPGAILIWHSEFFF